MSNEVQNSLINQMRRIVRAGNNSFSNSYKTGLELLQAGQYEKAVTAFREDIAVNPKFYFSYHYLGEALYKLNKLAEAEKAFTKSAALNPYFATTQMFLGDTAFKKGEFKQAGEFYRQAVALNPALFGAHKGLLKIYYCSDHKSEDSKLTESNELITRIARLAAANRQWMFELFDPSFADTRLYILLGDILQRDNQTDTAVICYQLAVTLDPQRAEIWLKLARIFFEAEVNEYASECQSKAAELKNDSVEIHNLLGEIWTKRGRYSEAIGAYQQAAELEPENAEFHKIIGDLQTKQGLINDARNSYNRAIELGYKIY